MPQGNGAGGVQRAWTRCTSCGRCAQAEGTGCTVREALCTTCGGVWVCSTVVGGFHWTLCPVCVPRAQSVVGTVRSV